MGATSLMPLMMSLALLSKTALDMTKWGTPSSDTSDHDDDRDVVSHHHRDDRRQQLGGWGERIVNSEAHARDTGRDFNDHQVNLADFYRKEAKRKLLPFHSANLIQSRKLYIDDEDPETDYGQVAMESSFANTLEEDDFEHSQDEADLNLVSDDRDDNFSVPDKLSALEDQIAMESLDKHLKKITQLPSGFKHKVEADLIRKLTTVSPAPIIKTAGSGSQTADGFPDIFIKHKGTPTPDNAEMYEPRLDPAAWNKHFQDRKSLRFAVSQSRNNPDIFAETRTQERDKEPQRRTLTQVMKKYSSVDPLKLIRKYQKSKTTLPPTISRKYPTKYITSKKDVDMDVYSQYTTASSFRNANKSAAIDSPQPTLAPSSRERFGSKLFDAQSIKISPKLTSIRDETSEVEKNRNHNNNLLGGYKNYKTLKAFHTTLVPVRLHKVTIAPTNTVHLDEYYNSLEGIKKRKYTFKTEKPKSFGQSLKDLFFPKVRNPHRKIVKVKKPLNFVSTTMKPLLSTISTLKSSLGFQQRMEPEKKSEDNFPYKFLKPIEVPNFRDLDEVPRSSLSELEDVGHNIDKQLVSPSDPDIDFGGLLATFLPTIVSVGAGLGVALTSVLSSWGSHIDMGQVPNLQIDKQGISIAYRGQRAQDTGLIPIKIDGLDHIDLGKTDGGREAGLSLKDPELVDLVLSLLPVKMREQVNNLDLKVDKFVFLRLLLTYLNNASKNLIIK